ncbi:MAG: molybdopterin dinucleotide binding domain-containing protein, partial [Candidatus Helarchaeota archaeon]
ADYILPAVTFLEREDFSLTTASFNPIPFACYSDPVVEPDGGQKSEWEIFNLLGAKMGLPTLGGPPINIFKSVLSREDRKKFRQLIKSEKGIFLNEEKKVQYNVLLPDRLQTPDKLINLVPKEYYNEFNKLRNWNGPLDKNFPFLLISGREISTINSWLHTKKGTNYCYISTTDANTLGIEDLQTIQVRSKVNFIEIPARITDDLMKGVIWIPHGWGRTIETPPEIAKEKQGYNVNIITDDNWKNLETFAGMVLLDGINVQIKKL